MTACGDALGAARAALDAGDKVALEAALALAEQQLQAEALASNGPRHAGLAAELAFLRLYAVFISMAPTFHAGSQAAAEAAQKAKRDDLVARVLALRAFAYGRDDQIDQQVACARQALALAPADAFTGLYVHLALAGSLHWIGEFERTSAHYRPALAHARALGNRVLEAFALRHIAVTEAKESRHAWEAGRGSAHMAAQAEASLRGCIDFYHQHTPRRNHSYAWLCMAETLLLQDRFEDSLALYDQHLPVAVASGLLLQAAEGHSRRARCLLALGRADEALLASDQGLALLATYEDPDVQATVQGDRARVLRALGRSAEADAAQALAAQGLAALQALRQRYRSVLLTALDGLLP